MTNTFLTPGTSCQQLCFRWTVRLTAVQGGSLGSGRSGRGEGVDVLAGSGTGRIVTEIDIYG